jgi:sodium-dependent dicarboxylate transporter 2/3/5
MWISNTAATAMMFPVTMGIIHVLAAGSGEQGAKFARSPYASALLLMTGYASSVGGIATPVGTATNVVALGFLEQSMGQGIGFTRWSLVGVPMVLIIFAALFCWLRLWAPADRLNMPALREYLQRESSLLGPLRRGEWNTLLVFAIVVGMWIAPGVLAICGAEELLRSFTKRFPEEVVAILAPVLLYLLPIDWRRREFTLDIGDLQRIDWGTILLFGAGLSLGGLMFKTGLANVVGQQLFDLVGTRDVWIITALAVVGAVIFSEFTSNAATVSALLPVVMAVCSQAEIDPVPPLMGATFGASFGSALPVSTMPNAIVYGSGLLPVRRMVVAGIGLDILAAIAVWCVLRAAFALGWTPFGE